MPHTYTKLLFHCVFSTKERRKLIPADLQPQLWAYMGGIARTNDMRALAVGGTEDHAHLLLSLPPTMVIAKAVQLIKAGSSKWLHQKGRRKFSWQEAYAAFTIGVSPVPATVAYIRNQPEHHRRRRYEDELMAFLKKHDIEYEERFLLG